MYTYTDANSHDSVGVGGAQSHVSTTSLNPNWLCDIHLVLFADTVIIDITEITKTLKTSASRAGNLKNQPNMYKIRMTPQ